MSADESLTMLLARLQRGDRAALDELLPLVYGELRAMADRIAANGVAQTLQATALVNEFCVKLIARDGEQLSATSRGHFFGVAAKAMRNLLANYARRNRQEKRGGGWQRVTLAGADPQADGSDDIDLIALHDALEALESSSPRAARVAEMRFLGGMTIPEVARTLDVTERTVERDWRAGRAFLRRRMQGDDTGE